MKKYTVQEAAQIFGCSIDSIREQYAKNAKGLRTMADKAQKTGKKVNGYTFAQLDEMAKEYLQRSL